MGFAAVNMQRIASIGLSDAERQAIIDVLFDGKTHREAGGGSRWASMKRIQRARAKARRFGVIIPSAPVFVRRVHVNIAEIRARALSA